MNMQCGTNRSAVLRFPPAILSLTIWKVINGDVSELRTARAFSDFHHVSGALVSSRSLTRI